MNKKAQVTDLAVIIIIIMIAAIGSIISWSMFHQISTQLRPSLSPTAQVTLDTNVNKFPSLFDTIITIAFVALSISIVISVALIDTHPAFFFVGLIIYIILAVVMMMTANVYSQITTSQTLGSFAKDFPMMNFIYNHLLTIYLAVGALISIVLYGKSRSV